VLSRSRPRVRYRAHAVTDFAFATCLPGLEGAVKREVARTRPALRFAYSRPGLVTFKAPGPIAPDDVPASVFARVWGRSLGAAATPADAARQLEALAPTHVHVFARDPDAADTDLAPWRAALGTARSDVAASGDLVADVIVATQEPAWIGAHRHDEHHVPYPGGLIPVEMPADAPSRAYAKIEEAIAWRALPVERGQVALEIGAAPGGAVMALARRGLEVYGVDTGELAPHVRALPGVHHLAMKVGALRWEQLPPRVDWLLVDVNLAPQVALHEVARLMPRLRPTLRGAVITLKLNDVTFVDALPALTQRIAEFGFTDVRLRHLPSNRREICVVAV
jgi:23S rRNA (cytidine2498-2'-O)-methyltransferase